MVHARTDWSADTRVLQGSACATFPDFSELALAKSLSHGDGLARNFPHVVSHWMHGRSVVSTWSVETTAQTVATTCTHKRLTMRFIETCDCAKGLLLKDEEVFTNQCLRNLKLDDGYFRVTFLNSISNRIPQIKTTYGKDFLAWGAMKKAFAQQQTKLNVKQLTLVMFHQFFQCRKLGAGGNVKSTAVKFPDAVVFDV